MWVGAVCGLSAQSFPSMVCIQPETNGGADRETQLIYSHGGANYFTL